jgi:hypothetical protein
MFEIVKGVHFDLKPQQELLKRKISKQQFAPFIDEYP